MQSPLAALGGRRLIAAALAAGLLLSLTACGWDIDPLASIGSSLKGLCRSSDSCSAHEPEPPRH